MVGAVSSIDKCRKSLSCSGFLAQWCEMKLLERPTPGAKIRPTSAAQISFANYVKIREPCPCTEHKIDWHNLDRVIVLKELAEWPKMRRAQNALLPS